MQKRFPKHVLGSETANSRELRKTFVEKLLEEYTLEESILQSCRKKYEYAFNSVYLGRSDSSVTATGTNWRIAVDYQRGMLKLQKNEELNKLGFMW